MPLPQQPITVPYLGMFNLTFKIFTTTYPNFAAWDWALNSLQPMEFHDFSVNNVSTGLWAQLIDKNTGYTTLSFGDNTPGNRNTTEIAGIVQDNLLCGFAFGNSQSLQAPAYSFPAILGQSITSNNYNVRPGVDLPTGVNNTAVPASRIIPNIPFGKTVIQLATVNLNQDIWQMTENAQGVFDLGGTPDLDIENSFSRFLLSARYNPKDKLTYLLNGASVCVTNFSGLTAIDRVLTYVNPPNSDQDINSLLTTGTGGSSTYPCFPGWIKVTRNVGTIEGQAVNGYAVVILPDFSGYYVLRLIQMDAPNWLTVIGEFSAKFDASGNFWMKNANFHQTLYISAGPVLRTLPVYPPIPLPGRAEKDVAMLLSRSGYDGE